MRVLRLPPDPELLVFDLDSTLYEHPGYASFQNEVLVERLARERGEALSATRARVEAIKEARRAAGLGKTSLGKVFLELGVDVATSVRWREEEIRPAEWLAPDPELRAALERLTRRFRLALLTNNPRSVGEASLEALGVRELFPLVRGLDDAGRSKPDPEPFALLLAAAGCAPWRAVSIGDREDVDLVPAMGLGMGAILVEAVAEVYGLSDILGA